MILNQKDIILKATKRYSPKLHEVKSDRIKKD